MKLIEALKKTKDLQRKANDLRTLVRDNCARSSLESNRYADQQRQVREWIQAHSDILKEILRLRIAIQRTNLETSVSVELGEKIVTKTIAEWIHRRRDLAAEELKMWSVLSDRGVKEGMAQGPAGDSIEIKVVRFYDPIEKDRNQELYKSEPVAIDSKLEIANAITDLME